MYKAQKVAGKEWEERQPEDPEDRRFYVSPVHHTWLEGRSYLSASGTELSCQIVVAGHCF